MSLVTAPTSAPRRVVLLTTDERAGLVAEISVICAGLGLSLEMVTGPGHILITFAADAESLATLMPELLAVPGVIQLHPYTVQPRRDHVRS